MRKIVLFALLALAACARTETADVAGRWEVQQIAGASLGEGVDVWIEINADANEMIGFTGCNNFSAPLSTFGDAVTVGAIAEEVGECADPAAATDEARFLAVLPNIQRRIVHGDSLELSDATPGVDALIKLRRVTVVGG